MYSIDKLRELIRLENESNLNFYEPGVFKIDSEYYADDKERFIEECNLFIVTNSYYGMYLRKARLYSAQKKYEEAIEVLKEGIKLHPDESLYFAMAKNYEEQDNWQAAMNIYSQFIYSTNWEIENPYCYYKYAYILKNYAKDLKYSQDLMEDYLKKYPVKDVEDFERKAPLYCLIIENLLDKEKKEEAEQLLIKMKQYDSVENIMLQYIYIDKTEGNDTALAFMGMDASVDSLWYTTTANEITYTKRLYDEGIYFTINPLAENKYYVKKNVNPLEEGYRTELTMFDILPMAEYGARMPINPKYMEAATFVWENMEDGIREIIQIKEDKERKEYYFKIYQHSDRWSGSYDHIYRNIKYLTPYAEDCHFFISEDYSNRVDEYIINNGKLYFHVGYAKNEFVKGEFIKERLLEKKDLPYLKKYLSFKSLPWKALYPEREKFIIDDKKFVIEDKKKIMTQLEKAIKYDAENEYAWYQKGIYHKLVKENKEAQEAFKKALELNKTETIYLFALAEVLADSSEKKDKKEAIQYLDALIALEPENKAVLYLAEEVYTKLQDQHNATVYQKRICETFKKKFENSSKKFSFTAVSSYEKSAYNNNLRNITGDSYDDWIKRASILYHIEKWKEAENAYNKALERNSNADIPYIGKANLCWFLYTAPDYNKAMEYCDKALTINPDSEHAWCTKGSALNNLGKYKEALECLNKSLKINSRNWQTNYCKACVYALMNEPQEAIQALKKTLAINSSYTSKLKLYHEKDFKNLHDVVEFWKLVDPES